MDGETGKVGFAAYLAQAVMVGVIYAVYYLTFGVVLGLGGWIVLAIWDKVRGTSRSAEYAEWHHRTREKVSQAFGRGKDKDAAGAAPEESHTAAGRKPRAKPAAKQATQREAETVPNRQRAPTRRVVTPNAEA